MVTGKAPLCTEEPEGENRMYRAGGVSMKGQKDAMKQRLSPHQPKAIFLQAPRPWAHSETVPIALPGEES